MQTLNDGRVTVLAGETVPVFCSCGHVYQPQIDSDLSQCPRQACRRINIHLAVEVKPATEFTFENYVKPPRDLPWDPLYVEGVRPVTVSQL